MILPLTPKARAKVISRQRSDSVLVAYAAKPVEFAADILGVRLTADQELILNKLMDSPELNVQSSHGQGKTLLAGLRQKLRLKWLQSYTEKEFQLEWA